MSDTHLHSNGADKPQRKKRGLKWFFVDLWWVHLIAVVVITLCVTLPLVYVAYPKIAQDDVNSSKLNLTRISITQPRPDGFTLNLTTELEVHTLFHPKLHAFNGSLYSPGANASYLTLEIPALKGKTGATTKIDKVVTLTDAQIDPFSDFVSALVASDNITSHLVGRGGLKLGALYTTHVNYNKSLTQGGFSGLKGIELTDSRLLTGTQPDNATLAGKVHIPNNSGGTFELGNVTFGLSLAADVLGTDEPTAIGYATVNNTFLNPGVDNVFDIRSVANQTTVIGAVGKNATYLKTGLPITIVTRKVEYNGEEIPWLTKALLKNPVVQYLNISEILANSQSGKRDESFNGWVI